MKLEGHRVPYNLQSFRTPFSGVELFSLYPCSRHFRYERFLHVQKIIAASSLSTLMRSSLIPSSHFRSEDPAFNLFFKSPHQRRDFVPELTSDGRALDQMLLLFFFVASCRTTFGGVVHPSRCRHP